jgi:hypothetical protein
MELFIFIVVLIVAIILIANTSKSKGKSLSAKTNLGMPDKQETNSEKESTIFVDNPEAKKLLNQMADIGLQAILSTEMDEDEKIDILNQSVDSILESTANPHPYISRMIKSAYKSMIDNTERYSADIIEKMKTDLAELEKQTIIGEDDYYAVVRHSLDFQKNVTKLPQKIVAVETFHIETTEERKRKDSLFEHYLEANKDLTYEEIEQKIQQGRKSNYEDYTEESKMEFRALKTLQERIRTKNFRDFFMEKKFLADDISSQDLNRYINEIDSYIRSYKMQPIPEEIINEAKQTVEKIKFNEYRELFTSKSILQLKNWMDKQKGKSFPVKIEEYYKFRLENEEEEYRLTKEITRLKNNISQNAKVGNLEQEREYEPLLREQEKKLDDLKKSFFNKNAMSGIVKFK